MLNNSISVSVSASRASFIIRTGDFWFSCVGYTCAPNTPAQGGAIATDSEGGIYIFTEGDVTRRAYHVGIRQARFNNYIKELP